MTRRSTDSRQMPEMAFKQATAKPAPLPAKAPSLPGAKEMVSLRVDRDVLDHFQEGGPAGKTVSMMRCGPPLENSAALTRCYPLPVSCIHPMENTLADDSKKNA